MKIVITSPRAPVSYEWAKILQKSGHEITFVDSYRFPLGGGAKHTNFKRITSPVKNFSQYRSEMHKIIQAHDFIIPTCEDIFHLSRAFPSSPERDSIFMPQNDLLLNLHHKMKFFEYMNSFVNIPPTKMITSKDQIDLTHSNSILKPVFSRFGVQVVQNISSKNTNLLPISSHYPWVQQSFIQGNHLCNFAIIQEGQVIDHVVYIPRYKVNTSAATYFEYTTNSQIDKFISQFAQDTHYSGQVAFDFIQDNQNLYVLECNPRATSGLHLMSGLNLSSRKIFSSSHTYKNSARLGSITYCNFACSSLIQRNVSDFVADMKKSNNVLTGLPFFRSLLSVAEIVAIMLKENTSFASATTRDIEYNG